MIFVNKEWDAIDDIIVYSNYHKYWQNKELRIKNPYFDVFSGRILDLKEGKQSAVKYFYNLINEEICKDVTICVVPSSDADKKESGIGMLGEMLAADGRKNTVYLNPSNNPQGGADKNGPTAVLKSISKLDSRFHL